jgi:hypothetical protein
MKTGGMMGFLKLNRFGDPGGAVFEPAKIIDKVRKSFAGAKIVPADQLAESAEHAAAAGAADHVVQTLRRNQQAYGPSFAFEIPLEGGSMIQGRARRFDVTFLFSEPLPQHWHDRLLAFLQDLGHGKLECADTSNAGRN